MTEPLFDPPRPIGAGLYRSSVARIARQRGDLAREDRRQRPHPTTPSRPGPRTRHCRPAPRSTPPKPPPAPTLHALRPRLGALRQPQPPPSPLPSLPATVLNPTSQHQAVSPASSATSPPTSSPGVPLHPPPHGRHRDSGLMPPPLHHPLRRPLDPRHPLPRRPPPPVDTLCELWRCSGSTIYVTGPCPTTTALAAIVSHFPDFLAFTIPRHRRRPPPANVAQPGQQRDPRRKPSSTPPPASATSPASPPADPVHVREISSNLAAPPKLATLASTQEGPGHGPAPLPGPGRQRLYIEDKISAAAHRPRPHRLFNEA